MKIGICTSIKNAKMVEPLGFDYLEAGVFEIMSYSIDDFNDLVQHVAPLSVKFYAFNMFFPGDLKLVGPDVNKDEISKYLAESTKRVNDLGGKIIVFGSGGARCVPESWDKEVAFQQLVEVSKMAGKEAAKYGITIAIEPLNTNECNVINSVAEGIELVKVTNHPNVQVLSDFYHMRVDEEGMDIIKNSGSMLRHVHIARGKGRTFPFSVDEDIYDEFFAALKEIGYTGGVSVEGVSDNFLDDATRSLEFLKSLAI